MENSPNSAQKESTGSSNFRTPRSTYYQDDDETEPITCPFFSITLGKSHVKTPYAVGIPAKFHLNLGDQVRRVVLTRRGETWEMDCVRPDAYHRRFYWRSFVVDNNLNVGDGCVFELIHQQDVVATFKVQILRGDIPEEMLEKMNSSGGSADDPIVL